MSQRPIGVFQVLLLTLLILFQRATGDGTATEVTRAVGGSVTFHIRGQAGDVALWSFGTVSIVTVSLGDPPKPLWHEKEYKTRFTFPEGGSALTISQLELEDAGTYSVKMDGTKSTFTLRVYRELAVPTVSCVARNCSAGGCQSTLTCSATGTGLGNVSYGWRVGGTPWAEGPTLVVEEDPEGAAVPLTCVAQNAVSSRNVTVGSAGTLCGENTTHSAGTGSQFIGLVGIVVVAGLGVPVLLAVIVFCCRSKGWKIFHLSPAEATDTEATRELTTVYAQVNHCQQNFPSATRDNPKSPQTSGVDTTMTIYSTVKAPAQTDDEKMGNTTLRGQEVEEKSPCSSVI